MTNPDEHLTVRPGSQAGWTVPLSGEVRCATYGHELEHRCEHANGLIVGYCCRCSARVEIPWFRGGTMAALGAHMAEEADGLARPAPEVLMDLEHVVGLLGEDIIRLVEVRREVRRVQHSVLFRIGLG